ncbi:CoA pyrophosphatase [Sinimarinibacterium thermocellulolyticum]|uniref:CoA pyrophosphatase n=1 Tax=Sinimarinibacterium thermocellulolyticum TaxID=3170016 RepID=A0ABV2AA99_9GAMM
MSPDAVLGEMTELERRLRDALASTHLDAPRPLIDLELPLGLARLIKPALLDNLRPAAVLAPVLRRGDRLSMMFTVRSQLLRSHKGQISFPGGGRDAEDRDAVDNALREAHEEVGLDPRRVEVIGYLDDYPTMTRYLVTPVVGIVDTTQLEWRIDAAEVADIFEVPLEVVLDPASFKRSTLVRDGIKLPFYELQWHEHRIWGATAGMLWNLAQKVARS